MNSRHEAAAGFVDQRGAFAAQRFGGERRGIAADGDGGGMELHELRIGDQRAGARRHAQTFAARFQRIGGDGVERAEAAGGEDHRRGAEQDQPRLRPSRSARKGQ